MKRTLFFYSPENTILQQADVSEDFPRFESKEQAVEWCLESDVEFIQK